MKKPCCICHKPADVACLSEGTIVGIHMGLCTAQFLLAHPERREGVTEEFLREYVRNHQIAEK